MEMLGGKTRFATRCAATPARIESFFAFFSKPVRALEVDVVDENIEVYASTSDAEGASTWSHPRLALERASWCEGIKGKLLPLCLARLGTRRATLPGYHS